MSFTKYAKKLQGNMEPNTSNLLPHANNTPNISSQGLNFYKTSRIESLNENIYIYIYITEGVVLYL